MVNTQKMNESIDALLSTAKEAMDLLYKKTKETRELEEYLNDKKFYFEYEIEVPDDHKNGEIIKRTISWKNINDTAKKMRWRIQCRESIYDKDNSLLSSQEKPLTDWKMDTRIKVIGYVPAFASGINDTILKRLEGLIKGK